MPKPRLRAAVVAMLSLAALAAAPSLQGVMAAEPVVVLPGSPVVDGSFIEPYTNAWEMKKISKSGDVEAIGRWTDVVTIERPKDDGAPILVRRQRIPAAMGGMLLVNRVRRSDLVPITREILSADEAGTLQHVAFDGALARMKAPGRTEPLELAFDEQVFDWYLYGLLLIGFPLEQDYVARFPAMGTSARLEWREFRVTARESVGTGSGKQYDCWKVEVDDGLTFWVTRKSPYIIALTKGGEADGSTIRWDME